MADVKVDEFGRDIGARDEYQRDPKIDSNRPIEEDDRERDDRRRRRSSSDGAPRGRVFKRSRQSPSRDFDSYIPNYERERYNRHNGGDQMEATPYPKPMHQYFTTGTPYMMYPQFQIQPQMYMAGQHQLPQSTTNGNLDVPIMDPYTQDHLYSAKTFGEWLKQERIITNQHTREAHEQGMDWLEMLPVRRRYEIYKENYSIRQLRQFHNIHKDSQWMMERHHPDHTSQRDIRIAGFKNEFKKKWVEELEAGKWNSICYDEPEPVSGGGSDGASDVTRNELDADLQCKGVLDEEERKEQATKTLFIRSVPLKATRESIIELYSGLEGFKYVSLSEPKAPKPANQIISSSDPTADPSRKDEKVPAHMELSHRVGWIVFDTAESAENALKQMDGKRLLDTSIGLSYHPSTPLAPRIRVTPNDEFSTGERILHDLQVCEQIVQKLDEEWDTKDVGDLTRKKIEETSPATSNGINGDIPSESKDAPTATSAENDSLTDDVSKKESSEMDTEPSGTSLSSGAIAKAKHALDMWLTYLRRVHMFCYYSGCVENDSPEEMGRRCGDVYFRRRVQKDSVAFTGGSSTPVNDSVGAKDSSPNVGNNDEKTADTESEKCVKSEKQEALSPKSTTETSPKLSLRKQNYAHTRRRDRTIQYMTRFDQKAKFKINPPTPTDLVIFGGKEIDWEVENFLDEYVEEITPEKFKCKECSKMFRAEKFLKKHLLGRHDGLYKNLKTDLIYLNSYIADFNRVGPREAVMQSVAPPNSASTLATFQTSGPQPSLVAAPHMHHPPHQMFAATQVPQMFPMQTLVQPTATASYNMMNRRIRKPYPRQERTSLPPPPPGKDYPVDPRQVKSYVDLDAPAEGDIYLKYND